MFRFALHFFRNSHISHTPPSYPPLEKGTWSARAKASEKARLPGPRLYHDISGAQRLRSRLGANQAPRRKHNASGKGPWAGVPGHAC